MPVADGLIWVAQELARIAATQVSARRVRRRGATLRPGASTPMWNALVQAVRPYLNKRGEKIKLGRILGVPPQRVHDYFVARTAAPDAERTLLLLHWLSQRRAGFQPG